MRNSNEISFENWWKYACGKLRYPVMEASFNLLATDFFFQIFAHPVFKM
jgi:hypothetical protein